MFPHKKEIIIVLFIAIFSTILASPKFTSQMLRIPKDHVFVGMTTYFEDFYYYLDQFYQGKQGNLLTENRFSIERFPPSFVYFNHLLLGRIGGWMGWESYQSYNYFGILFKFLFICASYGIIYLVFPKSWRKRICAFIIYLYSTGFPNISVKNGHLVFELTQDIFRTGNRILARFGTSPNGMLTNLLFVIVFIYLFKLFSNEKNTVDNNNRLSSQFSFGSLVGLLIIGIFFADIVLSDAIIGGVLWGTFFLLLLISNWKRLFSIEKIKFKITLLLFGIIYIFTAAAIYFSVEIDPVYKLANIWDITQYLKQIKEIGIWAMLEGFGLQLWFFLYGFITILRKEKKNTIETIALLVTGFAIFGYLVPLIYQIKILGFRFIFSDTYIFISCFAVYAIDDLAHRINLKRSFAIIMTLYLSINLFNFIHTWFVYTKPLVEPDYHFTYIPDELYSAMKFLRTAEPLSGNVLASPKTSIDLMIPGLTGRYSYTGHFLTTYDADQKDENANNFFYKWTDRPGTHTFLKANNIRFIVVTRYSGAKEEMKTYYPFLQVVFENSTVTVFRYDPEKDT
jgi:hypothetical protein